MPQLVSIGVSNHAELLMKRLDSELRKLNHLGIPLSIQVTNEGDFTFFACDSSQAVYQNHLAEALAELIVNYWEPELLKQKVYFDYYFFTEEDKAQILEFAKSFLYRELGQEYGQSHTAQRKQYIVQKLSEYLGAHDQLIVEGFIKFRLKDYMAVLEQTIERAVDDFLVEREYREFVRLLKYFVDVQDPKLDKVQIVIRPDETFALYDGNNQEMKPEYLDGIMLEAAGESLTHEDMLVSTLINLAPRQVVLHLPKTVKSYHSIDTIKQVFAGRIQNCSGCSLCTTQH